VVQLHREESRIQDKGARLVIVGNGKPWFIQGFREKTGYEGEIYSDPSRATYKALHLRRDIRSTLSAGTVRKAFAAFRQGFRQTATQGDPWQQGGVFVFDASGEVVFSYASSHAGDHPSVELLLRGLDNGSNV
jgi:hypothetical protein